MISIFSFTEKYNKHINIPRLYMPVIDNNDIEPEIGMRYKVLLCMSVMVVVALVYFGLFYTK
jgi:hypothetical protein